MEKSCKAFGSCAPGGACNAKAGNFTGDMSKRRKDLIATPKFKKVMAEYGEGTLKSSSGADVNSPQQAKAIAAQESGQSYNQQVKKFKNADRFGMRGKK